MENIINAKLIDLILKKRGSENDEPLDGDEVEILVKEIKAVINFHEGNLTEEEFNKITRNRQESQRTSVVG